MAVEQWVQGTLQGTYASAFNAADINSLANGSSVLSSVAAWDNSTIGDMFGQVSISLASITVAAPNFLGIYLYPLNEDGTTYGDGQFTAGTQKAAVPSGGYWVDNILVPTGAAAVVGTSRRFTLPLSKFILCVYNQLGATLAASGNVIEFKTYNRKIA